MATIASKLGLKEQDAAHVVWLERIADYGLASVLFIAPLVMGGRYAPGRLLLAALVGITAVAWFLTRVLTLKKSRGWLWTGAEWIAGCAVLIVLLQLTPWSPSWLETLSPTLQQRLPMLSSPSGDGTAENLISSGKLATEWSQVSLAPQETRNGLATALIYVLFFFVIVQRVENKRQIERLMKGIALAGIAMAAIGIAQYLFNNGKFLWFMEHPSRDTTTVVKGTFANENHFMHFLALSLGPLLWWLVKSHSETEVTSSKKFNFGSGSKASSLPREQVLLCIGLVVVLLASLLSTSRGGLAVMGIAVVVATALFAIQGRIGSRVVGGVVVAILLAGLGSWLHGQDVLAREISTLQNISLDSLDQGEGRRKIWSAVTSAIPDFAALGSGLGSHRYVYPTYFASQSSVQYTHAESGYLHVLLEAGGAGFGLLLVAIGFFFCWIVRGLSNSSEDLNFLAVPLATAGVVSLVHAIFDFNWFIPANMCLTLAVAALAARLWSLTREEEPTSIAIPKVTWSALAGVALAMTVFSVSQLTGPAKAHGSWHEYLAWSLASKRFEAKSTGPGRQRSLGLVDASEPDTVARMIQLLHETVSQDPNHGRAHIRMAAMCLRQFELLQAESDNAMGLAQIRDAALTNEFESADEMRTWVQKVAGANYAYLDRVLYHCRAGLRATPTEGKAYLYLSEVAFLDPQLENSEFELLQQAYNVRPHDPSIQFTYGRQLLLAGDTQQALEMWKSAFKKGSIRKRIIDAIGFQSPPHELLALFEPDIHGLRDIFEYYRRNNLKPQMNFVGRQYVIEVERQAQLMTGEVAADLWLDAQFAYEQLGQIEDAATAAKNAVIAQPSSYKSHFACACRMRDAGQLEEAIREFEWCRSRKPDNSELPIVIAQLKQAQRKSQVLGANVIDPRDVRR